jgi:hypothetical protein
MGAITNTPIADKLLMDNKATGLYKEYISERTIDAARRLVNLYVDYRSLKSKSTNYAKQMAKIIELQEDVLRIWIEAPDENIFI